MSQLQDIIRGVRNIRNKFGLQDRHPLAAIVSVADQAQQQALEAHSEILARVGYLDRIDIGVGLAKPERSATEVTAGMEVFVPLAEVIDLDAERSRLQARIGKAETQLAAVRRKLENEQFVDRAPQDIVQRERDREEGLIDQIEKWKESMQNLL